MTRPLRHQQGNTLTGIIIGLIIGLGIAVVVALAITKGTLPFTDKSGKLGKAGEPTPGQASDPNKPLYGNKDAAHEANRQITEKAKTAADDPLGAAIATMKPGATPAPAAPAAPVAATPAAAPVAAADPADDKTIYFLQAGAFREGADAENTRAKLALLGFEATISDRTTDAGVLHRVRTGPYATVEAMNKAKAKLIESGVDVSIVKNQK